MKVLNLEAANWGLELVRKWESCNTDTSLLRQNAVYAPRSDVLTLEVPDLEENLSCFMHICSSYYFLGKENSLITIMICSEKVIVLTSALTRFCGSPLNQYIMLQKNWEKALINECH